MLKVKGSEIWKLVMNIYSPGSGFAEAFQSGKKPEN